MRFLAGWGGFFQFMEDFSKGFWNEVSRLFQSDRYFSVMRFLESYVDKGIPIQFLCEWQWEVFRKFLMLREPPDKYRKCKHCTRSYIFTGKIALARDIISRNIFPSKRTRYFVIAIVIHLHCNIKHFM